METDNWLVQEAKVTAEGHRDDRNRRASFSRAVSLRRAIGAVSVLAGVHYLRVPPTLKLHPATISVGWCAPSLGGFRT